MAKPRATGADAILLIAKETTYGTAPDGTAGGVYTRPLMKSDELDGSQDLEDDPLWNNSQPDDTDPSLGAFDASGNLVVPMCSRAVGLWLTVALGTEPAGPTDNGDGTFTHAWRSGLDLNSYTVQRVHPKLTTPKARTSKGAKAGGFSFPMSRTGRAQLTIPMTAQSNAKDTPATARDASPLTYEYLPFDNATGSIKIGGVLLANVTGAQINFTNNLDPVATIRPDGEIDGADEGARQLSGTFDLRFGTDHTVDDLVDAKTPAVVEFAFSLRSAPTWVLKFSLPRVFLALAKKPISGPGGINATTNWRAAFDAGAGHMLGITLLNDVESY